MIISRSNTCPSCGGPHSNSCYVVYDDGSKCYSCGYGSRNSAEYYAFRPKLELSSYNDKELYLPLSTNNTKKFSNNALKWLYDYYIYDELIEKYKIGYVEATPYLHESLLFPILESGMVVDYQRRYFPKAFFSSSGVKKRVFVTGKNTNTIVLVEDFISSIRVGEEIDCMCLFGTSITQNQINYLMSNYCHIKIWLDPDEPGVQAATKISNQLFKDYSRYCGINLYQQKGECTIEIISTSEQPKSLSPQQIKEILNDR